MRNLTSLSVLMVTGHGSITGILKKFLTAGEITQIHHAEYAFDAVEFLKVSHADVILINDNPPDLDGVALALQVRNDTSNINREVVIVLLGRDPSMQRVMESVNAGTNEFMLKPFTARKLLERIHANINDPRKFVVSPEYTGPDRRSLSASSTANKRRRKDDWSADSSAAGFGRTG